MFKTGLKTVSLCDLQFQKKAIILGILIPYSFWFKLVMSVSVFFTAVPEYLKIFSKESVA